MDHKFDWSQATQAATDLLAYVPTEKLPPTLTAMLGYASNKDFWRNRDVWRGPKVEAQEEFTRYTNPALVKLGGLTKMSPDRMGYALGQLIPANNFYASIVGSGLRRMLDTLPEKERQRATEEIAASLPGLNKIVRATDPMAQFKHSIEDLKMESTTKAYKQRRDFGNLLEDYYSGKSMEKLNRLKEFVQSQPQEDHDKLERYATEYASYRTIPDSRWWMELRHASPEARAKAFLMRYDAADAAEKKRLRDQAVKLPGINTDRFNDELMKARQGARP